MSNQRLPISLAKESSNTPSPRQQIHGGRMATSTTSAKPCAGRIHDLPNETLEQVMQYFDDLRTLHAFTQAYRQARVLFTNRPSPILSALIGNLNMAHQLKGLLFLAISLRTRKDQIHALKILKQYLDPYLSADKSQASGVCPAFTTCEPTVLPQKLLKYVAESRRQENPLSRLSCQRRQIESGTRS